MECQTLVLVDCFGRLCTRSSCLHKPVRQLKAHVPEGKKTKKQKTLVVHQTERRESKTKNSKKVSVWEILNLPKPYGLDDVATKLNINHFTWMKLLAPTFEEAFWPEHVGWRSSLPSRPPRCIPIIRFFFFLDLSLFAVITANWIGIIFKKKAMLPTEVP